MELSNSTPVPAKLLLGRTDGARRAVVTAKASFRIGAGGPSLDQERTVEIFDDAEDYDDDFILPADVAPGVLPFFEVMLVGHVASPTPITERSLTMRVGEREQHLRVVGDRHWVADGEGSWRASDPAPFTRMPLSWNRAYGGAMQVEIDEAAHVPMIYAPNPDGRGYWPNADVEGLALQHGPVADGYPRMPPPEHLPNLEAPDHPLTDPAQPVMVPSCWAPMPRAHAARYMGRIDALMGTAGEAADPSRLAVDTSILAHCWAHPSWHLPEAPSPGTEVVVTGVGPEPLTLRFPELRVCVDALVGDRRGTRSLVPQAMVLLPNEQRMTVTYRLGMQYPYVEGQRRALRVRLEASS